MDGAMLTFDGVARLAGRVETSEDYFEFRTHAALSTAQLNELHRATIEIDGRTEGVLVESTDWLNHAPDQSTVPSGLRLTLRRNIPTTVSLEDAER